ncbi:MAG: glycosyltransferase [Phycisphaerales bacterium]
MGESDIKVSALILTYNHERFIGEAIEGVLMQKTDFPYELVITEDCSTDGTRDVIRRYCQKYPDRVRVLLNRHNIGPHRTIVRGYQACRGRYVTCMDGDDYWSSPDKLQRQADLLDRHSDCAMCFHSVTPLRDDEPQGSTPWRPRKVQETYTLADILDCNFIAACSVMYRKGVFSEHPSWFFLLPVGDWTQHIAHAQHGKIGYIDEPMAVYRMHPGGVHSLRPREQTLRVDIKTRLFLRQMLGKDYQPALTVSLIHQYAMLAQVYREKGSRAELRACVRDCVLDCFSNFFRKDLSLMKMLAHTYLPGPYGWLRSSARGQSGQAG